MCSNIRWNFRSTMGKNTNFKCVNVHYFFITLKSLQKGKKNGTCLFKGCDIYGRKVEFVLLGWHGQKQNGGERLYLVRNKIKLSRKRQKSNCNKSKYKFYKCGVIQTSSDLYYFVLRCKSLFYYV